MRKRKERFVVPKSGKVIHELKLLNGRALFVVKHYLDYTLTENTHRNAKQLFTDYHTNKKEVIYAIKSAFKYLLHTRFDATDPDYIKPRNDIPSDARVKDAKKYLNALAKKILK